MPLYYSKRTETFKKWIAKLRDQRARARISEYLERLLEGNFSNVKSLGGGISELKIHYGPGYRVYYTERKGLIIILLAGGDKSTQERDIAKARQLAKEWKM